MFCKIDQNLNFDLILALFGVERVKNMATQGHNIHTPEGTSDMPVNQVSWSDSRNFLRKW